MAVITQLDRIQRIRIRTLRSALELEINGMKRHGRSAYSIIKEEFGFRGNRERVLAQLKEYIDEELSDN